MKTKYLYIVSALTLGLVGCSQEFQNDEILLNGPMSFNIVSPNATRVADGVFETNDKLGLYVTDYADAATPAPLQISGNRANNEVMTYNGTSWATNRPIYWGESKSDVYAYYPYMDIVDVDEQPFSVATDQSVENAYEDSDFLWAKAAGVAQTGGAVSLQMKHQMSRLVVKIMAGEDYVGSLPADATVHLHSTVTDARISLANGSAVKDPYGGAHSIKMRNLGIQTTADGEAVVYEAIVVPQMLETSVPLLEINSKSVSYLLEDSFNFKPGVSYTYTAVLNTSTTAIKIDIGCTTDDWNNIGGGSGSGDGSEGGEDDGIDLAAYTDLSTAGTANCYLIQAAGKYKFRAVQGNTDWTVGNVKKTEVLWETFGTDVMPNVGDLIAETGYKNGYVYFSTPETFANGNASIAVRNSKGVILWSWHIWCSEEGWNDHIYANNAGTMMDRNLGATSATPGNVGAFGLLYQWGRKDPFIGNSTGMGTTLAASTGTWNTIKAPQTVSYAEENPMTFVVLYSGSSSDWCTACDDTMRWMENFKTMYDPCPAGYRVPNGGENGFWTTALGTIESVGYGNSSLGNSKWIKWDSTNNGLLWILCDEESTAWYPAVNYLYEQSGTLYHLKNSNSFLWTSTYIASHQARTPLFNSGYVQPLQYNYKARGISVRCVKE